jgi:hypothetical protein
VVVLYRILQWSGRYYLGQERVQLQVLVNVFNTDILYQLDYYRMHEEDLYHRVSDHNGWASESTSTGDLTCHL